MAHIVIQRLSKNFVGPKGETVAALREINLEVGEKELLALVGPSGCGKTTALRLVAGLEEPSSGEIFIDGTRMNRVAPSERDIAMVFQNPALYPHMTVRENIAFGLRVRRCGAAEIERGVREVAEMLDLSAYLDRRPMELSGGQCQRVAVGRAIVRRPKIILFDEPLSNLDARMRGQMRIELARVLARLSATILYVTHDQVEALALGHRVAVMREGEVLQVGKPMEIYRSPANMFVAEFIGAHPINFIPAKVDPTGGFLHLKPRGESKPELHEVRWQTSFCSPYRGKEVMVGIRPEHVTVAGPQDTPQDRPRFAIGSLETIERTGPDTFLHLQCADARVVARVGAFFAGNPGDVLSLHLDPQQAHYFDPVTGQLILCGS